MVEDKLVAVEVVVRLNIEVDLATTTPQDVLDYFDNLFTNHPGQRISYNSSNVELMQVHQPGKEPIVIIKHTDE